MSPVSVKSKLTARAPTEKGTIYPPLPESHPGDSDSHFDMSLSPRARSYARSKAPSVSPSDSLSQIKVPYTLKNASGSGS